MAGHRHYDQLGQAGRQCEQHQEPGQSCPGPPQRPGSIHWALVSSIELISLARPAASTGPMTCLTMRPDWFTTNVSGTPRRPYARAVFEPASSTTGYATFSERT